MGHRRGIQERIIGMVNFVTSTGQLCDVHPLPKL